MIHVLQAEILLLIDVQRVDYLLEEIVTERFAL